MHSRYRRIPTVTVRPPPDQAFAWSSVREEKLFCFSFPYWVRTRVLLGSSRMRSLPTTLRPSSHPEALVACCAAVRALPRPDSQRQAEESLQDTSATAVRPVSYNGCYGDVESLNRMRIG
jgi:hypothetical protein